MASGTGTASDSRTATALARLLIWLIVLAALPVLTGWRHELRMGRQMPAAPHGILPSPVAPSRPSSAPPVVEPPRLYAIDADRARAVNAAVPFADRSNPAALPFRFTGGAGDLNRAIDCLAAAQYYEAGDDAVGERAVAQVVLNRVRHPAFPNTICGVIFQGQERRTGCQFTFSCDGALARTPSSAAWTRARTIASAAIGGAVFRPVGLATHYHTDWVVPYWSQSLDKTTKVGTHLFFRWSGWWGTPAAFVRGVSGVEPTVLRIARLSPAHRDETALATAMLSAEKVRDPISEVDTAVPPSPAKSWNPAPTMPLPVAIRHGSPVESVQNDAQPAPTLIALGPRTGRDAPDSH